uniref:Transposase (Putative), gypsy type n=1 Tax=Tanacetum cinerariifolium TaxID=118510 RepID=A0A699HV33_TANCI|nr:hypothetical protein [Tanacetum cinerariifolium]
MGRDTVQLETAVTTLSQEYLLELRLSMVYQKFFIRNCPVQRIGSWISPKANRVIEMEDPAATTDSSGVPSTIERSLLNFANENHAQQSTGPKDQGQEIVAPEVPPPENVTTTGAALEAGQAEGIAAMGPHVAKERHKRGNDRREIPCCHRVRKGSTRLVPVSQGAPVDVSDPDPLSFADPQSRPSANVTQSSKGAAAAGDPESENTSFTFMVGSPEGIYRPEWLRLGFEKETKLLKKSVAQVARQDKRIQARSAELSKELENMWALFSDLQVSNNRLSQQVSTLQAQVMGEEKLKAAFEEFKQYEDNRVEKRCVEMDARLDALSIYFDEELYLHMLTVIVGRRWAIGHGLRLAVMKCGESTELRQAFVDVVSVGIDMGMSEGLKHGVEHGKANLSLEVIEAYNTEDEAKYIVALHALKDLKYPIVDQLESLKDAPMDVIMASLHLESDIGDDAPQYPWAFKEEILLADAIAANVSRAEKKKKCRVVCRTHGVGSAHHARSDGVPVFMSFVAPQGLTVLLADAATQTKISKDGASPVLL